MTDDRKGHVPSDAEIADEARGLRDRAAESAAGYATDQKERSADRVEHVADALRGSAERLEPTERQLAELVGGAAGQLEGFAKTLREKDLSALMAEVESFGRRQPAVFMGAAVALGFGLARFAKGAATPDSATHGGPDEAYRPSHVAGTPYGAGHERGGPDPRPAFNPATPPGRIDQNGLGASPTAQSSESHLQGRS